MREHAIYLEDVDPVVFLGTSNSNFNRIIRFFPNLKVVARGNEIRISGPDSDVVRFEEKISWLLDYAKRYKNLPEDVIDYTLSENGEGGPVASGEITDDYLLTYGNHSKPIKAFTPNQKALVDSCRINDLVFAVGPAGSGKTYTAIALAVRALKNREVRRIVLSRPAVEAGESLGYLPGDMKEKLDPYLQPLYDALLDMIQPKKLKEYLEERVIEIAPLAFMRGRTLDNAFVILDEAQNATTPQMKMFLTRMGRNARFIITGDITQVDLPRKADSGLVHAMNLLDGLEGIGIIHFDERDIIRHKLVKIIVKAYEENNK